jgi:hypothetical protein
MRKNAFNTLRLSSKYSSVVFAFCMNMYFYGAVPMSLLQEEYGPNPRLINFFIVLILDSYIHVVAIFSICL